MKKPTSIKKLKRLMKLFPPIVELHLPTELLSNPDAVQQLSKAKDADPFLRQCKIFLFPIMDQSPLKVNNHGLSVEKLEAFRKAWKEQMQVSQCFKSLPEQTTIEYLTPTFVRVHSAINMAEYKREEKRLNNYLTEEYRKYAEARSHHHSERSGQDQ